MMSTTTKSIWIVMVGTICASPAMAGPVLTFEGLQNFERVENYYNGGTGSLGSGPGPGYGITFSSNGAGVHPRATNRKNHSFSRRSLASHRPSSIQSRESVWRGPANVDDDGRVGGLHRISHLL